MLIILPYLAKGRSSKTIVLVHRDHNLRLGTYMYSFRIKNARIVLSFENETTGYSYQGAMELRAKLANELNVAAQRILSKQGRWKLKDPIDVQKAGNEPDYNRCGNSYNIVAGAPANYHDEPCIFEVDAVKKGGPFTDPATGGGYPNYSFFIPSDNWLEGLLDAAITWLETHRGRYDVLIHPNSGCEVRDHTEEGSIRWMGQSYALLPEVFSCRALGCNQACPKKSALPPPADCPHDD